MTTALIISQRQRPDGFGRQPGYVSFTEGEDVLASALDADLVLIDRNPGQLRVRARRMAGRAARRVLHSDQPLPQLPSRVGQAIVPPRDSYDVAVFVGFTIWDLPLLETVHHIRDRAERIVAWFPEAWCSEFTDGRLRHEPFGLADAIFIGMRDTAQQLDSLVPAPVHHVPPAVDAMRFAPTGPDEPRPIDVLNIGRRDAGLHEALLDWSRKQHKLYLYDTISGSRVSDPTAHRENLSDQYRRTSIAMTNYAKYDVPELIGDQRETPGRLWEGLASGSIMAGFPPEESLQVELIGEAVVTPLPSDPSAAVDLIDELNRADLGPRRRQQTRLALLHHDWIHRWDRIFELAGVSRPTGFTDRLDRLAALTETP